MSCEWVFFSLTGFTTHAAHILPLLTAVDGNWEHRKMLFYFNIYKNPESILMLSSTCSVRARLCYIQCELQGHVKREVCCQHSNLMPTHPHCVLSDQSNHQRVSCLHARFPLTHTTNTLTRRTHTHLTMNISHGNLFTFNLNYLRKTKPAEINVAHSGNVLAYGIAHSLSSCKSFILCVCVYALFATPSIATYRWNSIVKTNAKVEQWTHPHTSPW